MDKLAEEILRMLAQQYKAGDVLAAGRIAYEMNQELGRGTFTSEQLAAALNELKQEHFLAPMPVLPDWRILKLLGIEKEGGDALREQREELIATFEEILLPWLETGSEFFAAVLLATYAWWRDEDVVLGLDFGHGVPDVMSSIVAAIVEHASGGYPPGHGDEITCTFLEMPHLFQREYESRENDHLFAEETKAVAQQEASSSRRSEVDVLLTRFVTEREFLANWLRVKLRSEVETIAP